jgi:hypothetical protein
MEKNISFKLLLSDVYYLLAWTLDTTPTIATIIAIWLYPSDQIW